MLESGSEVTLRPATLDDARLLFEWRNRPEIVMLSRSRRSVDWNEHVLWLQRVLSDPDHHLLFLVEIAFEPAGHLRFDRVDDESCEVSIYLLSGWTGRGFGVHSLAAGCREVFHLWGIGHIDAVVRRDNPRSRSAFIKAGFRETGASDTDVVRLRRWRPV
ncbi:MAG TPA: GNAT family N-acetyltransferase [Steroidobacteraceae bacterium]|nr:GNAT family N-acetyltransferase [Steroidobacteraceae bacterium]